MCETTPPSLFGAICPDLRDFSVVFSETPKESLGCHRIDICYNSSRRSVWEPLDRCSMPKKQLFWMPWTVISAWKRPSAVIVRRTREFHRSYIRVHWVGSLLTKPRKSSFAKSHRNRSSLHRKSTVNRS